METINGLTPRQHAELSKPLGNDAYLDIREDGQKRVRHEYVRHLLNKIYGHQGWSEVNLELREILCGPDRMGLYNVVYMARQRLTIHTTSGDRFYDGAGSWGVSAKRNEPAPLWNLISDAANGAQSIALCRATKSLGTRFGLALYADDPDSFPVEHSLPYLEWYEQHVAAPEQLDLTYREETAG